MILPEPRLRKKGRPPRLSKKLYSRSELLSMPESLSALAPLANALTLPTSVKAICRAVIFETPSANVTNPTFPPPAALENVKPCPDVQDPGPPPVTPSKTQNEVLKLRTPHAAVPSP